MWPAERFCVYVRTREAVLARSGMSPAALAAFRAMLETVQAQTQCAPGPLLPIAAYLADLPLDLPPLYLEFWRDIVRKALSFSARRELHDGPLLDASILSYLHEVRARLPYLPAPDAEAWQPGGPQKRRRL